MTPETNGRKQTLLSGYSFAETGRTEESPQFAVYFRVSRKYLWSEECVVADAVYVEPVSAANFPAKREKNREFCKFNCANPVLTDDMRVDSKTWG